MVPRSCGVISRVLRGNNEGVKRRRSLLREKALRFYSEIPGWGARRDGAETEVVQPEERKQTATEAAEPPGKNFPQLSAVETGRGSGLGSFPEQERVLLPEAATR